MVGSVSIAPNVGSAMVSWINALLIGVAAFLAPLQVTAEELRSRSTQAPDQSDWRRNACDRSAVTLYTERLSSLPQTLT